ncbi:MAG: hypothetical protein QXK88_01095 [Desulfurococcaceae archaeon]
MAVFLVAYDIGGSKPISRVLCYASKRYGVDAILLLGETISPNVVKWLYEGCRAKVLGVLGRCDGAAVAQALKEVGGLVECKQISVSGVDIYGFGLSGCQPTTSLKAHLFISNMPGLNYTCQMPGSDVVDAIVEQISPIAVIAGRSNTPCRRGIVFSPGSARRGYFGLLKVEDSKALTSVVHTDLLIVNSIESNMST